MTIIMLFVIIGYVALVFSSAKKVVLQLEVKEQQALTFVQSDLQKILNRKNDLEQEKRILASEAFEVFTLYEMTKEITKQLTEQEAFNIFKQHLQQHVKFEECHFLEPLSKEVKEFKNDPQWFAFPLQGKRRKIGFLMIKGLSEQNQENATILGHQFALAMHRVQLYREVERIAITDGLTEIYTRRHIIERLKEELNRSQIHKMKMAFLMIDVDHFKSFNDQYGHLAGDLILHKAAQVIKDNVREIDIVGRYGGEEFCVVLPDTDPAGALYAAERIRKAVEEASIEAYDTTVKTTVSIGIANFPQDGQALEELVEKADAALYQAKEEGRNRVC